MCGVREGTVRAARRFLAINQREASMTEDHAAGLLGRAILNMWPALPRAVQETLFDTAVPDDAAIRNSLAVLLHERHPRTAHPPRPATLS
jgi:hypothetical protein